MKNIFLTTILALALTSSVFAQSENGFGIKGGLNYNTNGDYFNSISNASEDPSATVGFHIGIFGKLGSKVYFKPELIYTSTKSDYNTGGFKMQKLDAPLLIGAKAIGPIHVFAGPALQYILDTDFGNASVEQIENDISIGLNFGIGLNINKLGIDLRYEHGFKDNEANIITNNTSITSDKLDTRPSQLILSFSYIL